jgi:hypothetical protein
MILVSVFGIVFSIGIDLVRGAEYYCFSAEQGNSDGQNSFGGCLEYGIGFEKDLVRGTEYYRISPNKAIQMGNCVLVSVLRMIFVLRKISFVPTVLAYSIPFCLRMVLRKVSVLRIVSSHAVRELHHCLLAVRVAVREPLPGSPVTLPEVLLVSALEPADVDVGVFPLSLWDLTGATTVGGPDRF